MTDLVRTDVPADFQRQIEMAKYYADSTLLPGHLRNKPANVLVILAGARSLNVSAFWALQSMHVIDGKLSLSAELMRGLAIRAGHRVRVVKREMDEAIVEITRSDRPDEPYRASFTWQEAVDAGLQNKDNWKKYRRAMLVARATSIAMRDECPDVLYGVVYTPDELGAVENEDGSIDVPTAEEVPAMGDEELAIFLANVASANSQQLIAYAREAKERGILDRPVGGATVQFEIVNRLKILADAEDATEVNIRDLWKVASGLDLLNSMVTITRVPGAEAEIVTINEALQAKLKMIKEDAERLAKAAEEDHIQDAEVVSETFAAPEPDEGSQAYIDTEHARRLREEAAQSWND